MYEYNTEWINLKDKSSREEVETFLNSFDLILDKDVDYTIIIRNGEKIAATCSKAKNVLKCFAVAEEYRGEGITAKLISTLIDKLFKQGIYHSFIFSKPATAYIFTSLNFKLLYNNEDVALLENGIYDINKALEEMKKDTYIKDVLGEHIFNKYILTKEAEWTTYNKIVHSWEIDNYLTAY